MDKDLHDLSKLANLDGEEVHRRLSRKIAILQVQELRRLADAAEAFVANECGYKREEK